MSMQEWSGEGFFEWRSTGNNYSSRKRARIPMILEDGRIDHVLSDICIIYWHETGQLIQEPGEIPEDALQMICEVNAHGDPHGSHSTYSFLEPGLELKRTENNVMSKIEHGKGSKPFFPRSATLL